VPSQGKFLLKKKKTIMTTNNLSQEKQEKSLSYGEFLKKARMDQGYSIEKVSEETKILSSIIKNLEDGSYENLPPPVYLKGMIAKYAHFLKLDKEKTINLYQQSNGRNLFPGKSDIPPKNRFFVNQPKIFLFIKKFIPKFLKFLFWGLVLLYFLYEASFFVLPATIILYSPVNDFTTDQRELEISGKLIRGKVLFINDQEVSFQDNGEFKDEIILSSGINNIKFKAINALNHQTVLDRQVIYTPFAE
jgi:transcriptional regulator with XRE-family HTH domain